MTAANSYQVTGSHYQGTNYQHWDWTLDTGMGYLEGVATKYVARWRKKGGVVDLQKALHFVNKLDEWQHSGVWYPSLYGPVISMRRKLTGQFNEAAGLGMKEAAFMFAVCGESPADVATARSLLHELIAEAEAQGQQPEVVRTEENHHAEREQS